MRILKKEEKMIEIIVLSFIQALTEFLPVSSSGHLIIVPRLLGWSDQGVEMDVAVHVGTLLAVLLFFRRELIVMITDTGRYVLSGCAKSRWTPTVKLSLIIVIATIPAVILGFVMKKFMCIPRSSEIIATTAIVFGILLWWADRQAVRHTGEENIGWLQGFLIGVAQAIALIPGTSRSGICITAGRLLGFDRTTAARFAFLLSIPTILGGAVLTGCDAYKMELPINSGDLALAISCSFIFGLLAIKGMMHFIARYSLLPFVIYRLILGIVLLMWG